MAYGSSECDVWDKILLSSYVFETSLDVLTQILRICSK